MENQKFDPKKTYKWDENQTIAVDGKLFGIVLNLLTRDVRSEEVQAALLKAEAYKMLQDVLQREVNEGRFKEHIAENEVPNPIPDIEFEEQQG